MNSVLRAASLATVVALVSVLAACGGGSPEGDAGRDVKSDILDIGHWDWGTDLGPADPGTDERVAEDVPEVEAEAEVEVEVEVEDPGADVELVCPGNLGCACNNPGDCYSGICDETMYGNFCSASCGMGGGSSCAPGQDCVLVSGGTDPIYGCLTVHANLCKPCKADADCVPRLGAGNRRFVCLDSGPEGRFCGSGCEKTSDCPDKFVCIGVQTPSGEVKQCRPTNGECPCTDKYKGVYVTACYNQNETGKCVGERTCDQPCNASVPKAEACNGEDDNCNGKTDEELEPVVCYISNQYGDCPGKAFCIQGTTANNCQGNQAAPEICNGLDDNCDGQTDENFADMDKDHLADCVDPDRDGDGVLNGQDNCPDVSNPDQLDSDGDRIGEACDCDNDNDGVANNAANCPLVKPGDNCVYTSNPEQLDADKDGVGDSCDCDADGDGVANPSVVPPLVASKTCPVPPQADNCLLVANKDQKDTDLDGQGDACDCDIDNDTVANNGPGCPLVEKPDNCPNIANLDQADTNKNGVGDACECDVDGDGVLNPNPGCPSCGGEGEPPCDNCLFVQNPDQRDANLNGVGDACDCDIDGDGVLNANPGCPDCGPGADQDPCDNCPFRPNPDQKNTTGEPYGDACNQDYDGDGVDNIDDNCPWIPNGFKDQGPYGEQSDIDLDGIGDACDCDIDGDGVLNNGPDFDGQECATCGTLGGPACDNCPTMINPDQKDSDNNRVGDACDCDVDGDGDLNPNPGCSVSGTGDCAPFDPTISRFATEKCNGVDDNCNGVTDEENASGCQTYYFDHDGDGYGTDQSKCLCGPSGYFTALLNRDCDDTDPIINPGAQEICGNGKDDNCNATENDENAVNCVKYYLDADGDKFGSKDYKCLCSATIDYSTTKTGDCDDTDFDVNPNKKEVCGNSKDDDCSGTQNDETAVGCKPFYFDGDGDGYGTADARCFCYESGNYRARVGCDVANPGCDCDDTTVDVNPGRKEICGNSRDDNCDGQQDTPGSTGCKTYYWDGDGDGFGNNADNKCLCGANVGVTTPNPKYTTMQGGDCNDNNASIKPGSGGSVEKCNGQDDDCNGQTDENPDALCGRTTNGQLTCKNGSCQLGGCDTGWWDLNNSLGDGCECKQDDWEAQGGGTCQTGKYLGAYPANGTGYVVDANIAPGNDEDWWVVDAQNPDYTDGCNNYNLVALFQKNPSDTFLVDVYRGSCSSLACSGGNYYEYGMNFYWADRGNCGCSNDSKPQCPDAPGSENPTNAYQRCLAQNGGNAQRCNLCPGEAQPNTHRCQSAEARYYIRVYRNPGKPSICDHYVLEITNGKYGWSGIVP